MFFADLKSTSSTTTSPVKKESITYSKLEIEEEELDEEVAKKKSFEDEVKEIMENPGRKRRRVTILKTEKVEEQEEKVVVKGEGVIEVGKGKKPRKQKVKTEEE